VAALRQSELEEDEIQEAFNGYSESSLGKIDLRSRRLLIWDAVAGVGKTGCAKSRKLTAGSSSRRFQSQKKISKLQKLLFFLFCRRRLDLLPSSQDLVIAWASCILTGYLERFEVSA